MNDSTPRVSTAEQWASAQARRTVASSILAAAILGVGMVALVISSPSAMWPLIPIWLIFVLTEWERVGFRRLLARRDAELNDVRSRLGSA